MKYQQTSFSWPRHMRAGGQSSPSLFDLSTTVNVLVIPESARGTGVAEISKQISSLAGI